MGTVKYTGPVASFHCPTNADIRSLKVHFSPKQEGSGTPSPENVREIVGWDGVEVNKSGRNLMHLVGYSAVNLNTTTATRKLTNGNGTTINTIDPEKSVTITQTLWPNNSKGSYQNGYFAVIDDNLKFEERYDISFRVTNITNNPLNATLSDLMIYNSKGTSVGNTKIIDGDRITFKNAIYNQNTSTPLRHGFDIRICGMSCTISDFIVTAVDTKDRTYEPYRGETIDYEFGVLGKNKFNWDVPVSESSPVGSNPSTAREFTLDTYVIGMSVNNYYRQNYTNWVLNPLVENGVISFSSNAASGYGIAFPLKLAAGQTYFLSGTGDGVVGATYYNEDGELISYQNGRLNKTITVPENTVTTLIGFYASTSNTDFTFSNIQLELGSTATTYEPYDPNHTVYGGWVDLISGEVAEEWSSSKCGDLSWYRSTTTNTYYYYEATISNKARTKEAMCAKYKLHDVSRSNLQNYDLGYYYPSETYYHRIAIRDDTYNDLESFISDNTNTLIYYEVTTPIIYHLAPTELQTFLGQNNVWSNANYVEVEYDLHETQDILNRKNFIIANQPHIVKPAAALLQNFVTDIAAPLKECKVYFNPVQDLHGYDKPWVGGGGKNLFDPNCDMWNYSVYTKNNDQITQSGSDGRGWADSNIIPISLKAGTYTLTCSDGNNFNIHTSIDNYEANISLSNGGGSFTLSEDCDVKIKHSVKSDNSYPTTFTVQLEEGSTATTYEPYENICPIEGWTGLETYRTGKSLVRFADSVGPTSRHYNGFSGWLLDDYWKIPDRTQTYTYSVYIDNRNAESDSCVNVWFRNETNTAYVRIVNGSKVKAGETGWSTLTFHNSNYYFAGLGLSLQIGGIAKNGMLEIGDTTSVYEPYTGITIPVTFPTTINLFNEQWEQGNIEVGNNASSSTSMRTGFIDVNPSTSYYLYTSRENNVFVFEYLEDGTYANKVNSVHTSHVFTTDSTTKKIRIADRNSGTETVNTGINYPSTATYYEPYGTIYGGYVDLVKGELVQEYASLDLAELTWSSWGDGNYRSNRITNMLSFSWVVYPNGSLLAEKYNIVRPYDIQYKNAVGIGLYENTVCSSLAEPTGRIVYKLATPIIYSLNVQVVKALRGTNNIWSNANGNIELKYWTH